MNLRRRFPLSWTSSLLVAGVLSACGGSGGFHVDDRQASLQPESAAPHETMSPPTDSSERIDHGVDPDTRERDPIFHLPRAQPRPRPTPTTPAPTPPGTGTTPVDPAHPSDPSAPPTTPVDPSNPTTPPVDEASDYVLPENTYATVRVRLFPIVEAKLHDVFQKTRSRDHLSLANDQGLQLKNLGPGSNIDLAGQNFEFRLAENKVLVDGKEISITPEMSLGLFPRFAESVTNVLLDVDLHRLKAAKVKTGANGGLPYRGIFLVKRTTVTKTTATVDWALINYVQLEDYVRGVVPSEIGASFHAEAVKAQALAARTYTLRNIVIARCSSSTPGCAPREWDVDPSTQFQSYVGAGIERAEITATVALTRGQYIKSGGAPILAMYHSSSGGTTVSAKDFLCKAFSALKLKTCASRAEADYPYLQSVTDVNNNGRKRFGHGVGLPQYSAQDMAKAGHAAPEIISTYYPGSSLDQITGN